MVRADKQQTLAIHLHLYYTEMWPELRDYLANIGDYPYDLFVTFTTKNPQLEEEIKTFKPDAKIWVVENRGYDVGPFIDFLHHIDLDKYDYILKIHTKDKRKGTDTHIGKNIIGRQLWVNLLTHSLLGSAEQFDKNIRMFSDDATLGMIGSRYLISSDFKQPANIQETINQILENCGYGAVSIKFIAGTMFMCRAKLLAPIKNNYKLADFALTDGHVKDGTLAHVMERLFGCVIQAQGYTIKGCDAFSIRLFLRKMEKFGRFILQIKKTKSNRLIVKFFRIPVFSKEITPRMEIMRHRKVLCRNRFNLLEYFLQKKKLVIQGLLHKLDKNELKKQKELLRRKKKQSTSNLGIAYNVFDGEELLEASIKSVRDIASYIVVVYQTISNFKEKANPELVPLLLRLKEQGLIDDLYLYEPRFDELDDHYNEKHKRDIGLALARRAGCDYFLSMDADEFYHVEQIKSALDFIYDEKIESSAVSIIEYLKDPTNQLANGYTFAPTKNKQDYNFYVPFIMKVHRFKEQKHTGVHFPCLVDPTRGLNNRERFYLFPKHVVAMHHMCTVRKDLARKYANSNLRKGHSDKKLAELQQKILNFDFDKNIVKVSEFDGIYVQKVPNVFGIDIDDKEVSNA